MEQKFARSFQTASIAIIVLGCFLVLRPFLTAILLAAVVCVSTWPVFTWMRAHLRGINSLAALLTSLLLVLVLVVPLALVALSLADNVTQIVDATKRGFAQGSPSPPHWLPSIPLIGESLDTYWHELVASQEAMLNGLRRLLDPAKSFLLDSALVLGEGVLQMSLAAFIAFFFYRDGEYLVGTLLRAMHKVAGDAADDVLATIANTTVSVAYGLIGTALAQAAAAVIGFWMAGVPAPLLLGAATFLLSLAPMGPPIVWGGAALWLYWQDNVGWAIFMVLWGVLVVSSIDNFLKPYLISRGSSMPFALVLLGVLGGVIAFGFIGLFLGPVLLAVGLSLARRWTSDSPASPPSA
jgi:predicted PurR-regulated permease PerM